MSGLDPAEVILSVMALRHVALVARVQAVAKAGFCEIGIRLDDYLAAMQLGMDAEAIDQLLKTAGVRVTEVEFLREWAGRERSSQYRQKEAQLLAMASRLGARHVNVAMFDELSVADIAASLKGLCQRAAAHHLIVQLEFMPYTPPVNSLQKAWDIVRAVNEPNAGLLIDAWHYARTPGSAAALARVDPQRVTSIQLGDVLPEPLADVTEESRHYRCVPGEGALDLPRFLRTLYDHGISAPLSVEVMSDALDAMPPEHAAARIADGLRRAFGQKHSNSALR